METKVQELSIAEDKQTGPKSFVLNAGVASEEDVIFKVNSGPICSENARIGICAASIDLQTLDALNDMEQVQGNIVRVEQVYEVSGKLYL